MEFIKKYWNNELLRASIVLLVLSNIANLINLAFQFLMARMLNLEDFGALSFISNLVFVFGVPALAIQTAISRKTTELNLAGKYGNIKGLFKNATKRLFFISLGLMLTFIILAYFFSDSVKMSFFTLALSSTLIVLSFLYPVILGVMQGMKKFVYIGWNSIINFSAKLFIALILVFTGFKIYGALIGIISGMFIAWLAGLWILRDFKNEKEEAKFYKLNELLPFIALLIITLTYAIDILIGKFLFDPETMGNYSKISLIGKIILFACLSIGTVMFPISSERHMTGERTSGIIRKSALLTAIICLGGILVFYLFPDIVLGLLFGGVSKNFSSLLAPTGIAFSLISGISLIVLYGLSINKFNFKESFILAILFVAQVIALILSSQNLQVFVATFAISSAIIFISLLALTLKWKKSA
jgi:O-antigen/teichoic acid export membrane protein